MKVVTMFTGMLMMMGFNYLLKGLGKKMVKLKIFMVTMTMFYSVGFIRALEKFMVSEDVQNWINSLNGKVTEFVAYVLLILLAMLTINLFNPLHKLESEVRRSAENKSRRREKVKEIY